MKIRRVSSSSALYGRNSRFFNKVYVVCGNIAFASTFHSSALWRSQPSCLDSSREDRGSRAFRLVLPFFPATNCARRRQSASDGARGVTLCRLKPDKTTSGEKKNGGTLTNRRKMPTRDVGGGSSADAVALFPLVHVDLRFFLSASCESDVAGSRRSLSHPVGETSGYFLVLVYRRAR